MLWDIRALMKPALSVIDMIPDIHRTPALAALRRAVLDGRPLKLRLSDEEKDLAFHEANVTLTSPMGAKILLDLYRGGHLKLKKPARKSLPTLEAYVATEPEFRAKVAAILAAEQTRLDRLAEIIADPSLAHENELSPVLIDKVMTKHLGYGATGSLKIAGLDCHREMVLDPVTHEGQRAEGRLISWWIDAAGNRQGEA